MTGRPCIHSLLYSLLHLFFFFNFVKSMYHFLSMRIDYFSPVKRKKHLTGVGFSYLWRRNWAATRDRDRWLSSLSEN